MCAGSKLGHLEQMYPKIGTQNLNKFRKWDIFWKISGFVIRNFAPGLQLWVWKSETPLNFPKLFKKIEERFICFVERSEIFEVI